MLIRGTITATTFNFNVDGDFSYDDDTNTVILLGVTVIQSYSVSGNVDIVAADFANSGAITVTNSWKFYRYILLPIAEGCY